MPDSAHLLPEIRDLRAEESAALGLAWKLYEHLGFRRAPELDFLQQDLPVYGLRLPLASR